MSRLARLLGGEEAPASARSAPLGLQGVLVGLRCILAAPVWREATLDIVDRVAPSRACFHFFITVVLLHIRL